MFSGNYRHPFLDYVSPGIFMITLMKKDGIPFFSYPHEDKRFSLPEKRISTRYYGIGQAIRRSFEEFKDEEPKIGIIQHVIMPDHLHFILQIRETLDEHLGRKIGRLRNKMLRKAQSEGYVSEREGSLFQTGYNDQYLNANRSLKDLINYVKLNPYNLWIRKQNPNYFQKLNDLNFCDEACRAYGNLSLLANPFKYAVVVHRRFSSEELERRIAIWRYAMRNGGVLVSAFIHSLEKRILEEALAMDAKVIKLDEVKAPERWKPSGEDLQRCNKGNFLHLYPIAAEPLKRFRKNGKNISREECKYFNAFAEKMEGGMG